MKINNLRLNLANNTLQSCFIRLTLFSIFILNSFNHILRRHLQTASVVFIRDRVDNKVISEEELDVLSQGENYLHSGGSFHVTELSCLLKVCIKLSSCYQTNSENKKVIDYKKIASLFINSRFHNPKLMQKFVSIAGHLKAMPEAFKLLRAHHQSGDATNWHCSALNPAGVWSLPKKDCLDFLAMVNSGKITSEQKSRKYLQLYTHRQQTCVSFLIIFYFFFVHILCS